MAVAAAGCVQTLLANCPCAAGAPPHRPAQHLNSIKQPGPQPAREKGLIWDQSGEPSSRTDSERLKEFLWVDELSPQDRERPVDKCNHDLGAQGHIPSKRQLCPPCFKEWCVERTYYFLLCCMLFTQ